MTENRMIKTWYTPTALLPLLGLIWMGILGSCTARTSGEEQETATTTQSTNMDIRKEPFGKTKDGIAVELYTLTNGNGMTVKISNYGGIVTSIVTLDKEGKPGDVVLGFDNLENYLNPHPYLGALIGRYGNRIAKGRFTLEGKSYTLATNNGPNHLHGGLKGFDKVIWEAEEVRTDNGVGLRLTYTSPDGEEGYPGNLTAIVTYTLTDDNGLRIDYDARTDQTTHVNLTNHSYFNLAAGNAENALNHEIAIFADRYTQVDDTLIPTGELPEVKGTPMDFTQAMAIGARIDQVAGGYDHNYVLNNEDESLALAATVYEPTSGRYLEVYTTQPGVQFYSGNFLDGSLTGKGEKAYVKHYGFCLETQHFPDSPNQPHFPSTLLEPGQIYYHTTIYRFSIKDLAQTQATK
jgi:aldose 1-epimerase